MSLLHGVEFFTTTVEAGSFVAAARRLKVTPSAVSRRIARLERELGVPLLARTTRSLRVTDDGQAFYERCARIVTELREARDVMMRARTKPSGILRVDVPVSLGRIVIGRSIGRFVAAYPEIRLDLTLRDQLVDPIAEGLDVLVRIGRLGDSTLIARKLGESRIVSCAAPSYLRRFGTPKTPADLARHRCLGYVREGRPAPFELAADGGTIAAPVEGPFHANDAELLRDVAVAGKGIVALFDFVVRDALDAGALVPVLPEHTWPSWPIHALYPKNRHLLPKVAVLLDFLTKLFDGRRRGARAIRARS